ncbi:carboxylesterase/lipase family protein [Actinocrispum wychmicini]|uniref:Carboxylic ester hydrolase n=1 Tax=Actinocrispum wychmicini TaxID=1213861 RepID=A0A4R2JPP1_9PSEU|nr:carboxylesterase family protein [Actinocrispum wychmicini]TCO62143.1 para-nitrobenzyl esterase [Actinocrispum wychmicini]
MERARTKRRLALVTLVVSAVALTGVAPASATTDDAPLTVTTDSGKILGTTTASLRQFNGVPYAAPPVGDLRWQPPAAVKSWDDVRDATKTGSSCPQDKGTNEDCLYLNVSTPKKLPADGHKLPVMVWIHGGSFKTGSGADYSPDKLVNDGTENIIVVTINYRLGALGFLAHPKLAGTDGELGNYGIMDQEASLKWVQSNISAFGGDADKVTVAGESAGGIAVCALLASPSAAGLFRAAIDQSGPCQSMTQDQGTKAADTFATNVGCADADDVAKCLRGLSVDKIMAAPTPRLDATSGGTMIPLPLGDAIVQGKFNKVPVMMGNNRDEMSLFVWANYDLKLKYIWPWEYKSTLAKEVPSLDEDQLKAIVEKYPVSDYEYNTNRTLSAVETDWAVCKSIPAMAKGIADQSSAYVYEFNDRNAPQPPAFFGMGAYHASELMYLWTIWVGSGDFRLDLLQLLLNSEQKKLSKQMVKYWTQFVATGDPNPDDLTAMPSYDPTTKEILSLQTGGNKVTEKFSDEHRCDFWADYPAPAFQQSHG